MIFSARRIDILEALLIISKVVTATSLKEKEINGRATSTTYFQTCSRVLNKLFNPMKMRQLLYQNGSLRFYLQ